MLILGGAGFLGGPLAKKSREAGYEVTCADQNGGGDSGIALVDITDRSSVEAVLERVRPKEVALLAALSDIDRCEAEPDRARRINVEGAANVARACAARGARLVFTSSAAVFDGLQHGYAEDDPPTPVSVYGRTKAEAERIVSAASPSSLIVRLGLVIGFAGRPGTNSMLDSLARRWSRGDRTALPTYEYRNPIDAASLSRFLLELLDAAPGGVYHVGSTQAMSRYELGLKLARRMGYPGDLVTAQDAPIPGRAPRGLDHFLLTGKLRTVCRIPVPSCDDVIERCFHGTSQSSSRA